MAVHFYPELHESVRSRYEHTHKPEERSAFSFFVFVTKLFCEKSVAFYVRKPYDVGDDARKYLGKLLAIDEHASVVYSSRSPGDTVALSFSLHSSEDSRSVTVQKRSKLGDQLLAEE